MLRVNALHIVRRVVNAAHRTVAEMSVGVKTCSGTDDRMYSIANCVADGQVNNQIVETAVGGTQMLRVNAMIIVRTVVHATHRGTTQMSVGVETCSGTDYGMYSITEGVVHRQIDNQIVVTAVGSAQVLRVNALHIVGRIVAAAHGTVAEMSVGVESCSGTDDGMYGVTDGIVDSQIDNQIMETAVGGAKMLCINALHIGGRVVAATHGRASQMSVGVETCSGTDNGMDGVAKGVVDMQIYYQIIIMHCQAIQQILSIDTCVIIFYTVSIKICPGTYCSSQGIANGNNYHQITGTIGCRISQMLHINACILVSYVVSIEIFAGPQCSIYSVADGVVHRYFHNIVVETTVGIAKILLVHTRLCVRGAVHDKYRARTNRLSYCIPQSIVHP